MKTIKKHALKGTLVLLIVFFKFSSIAQVKVNLNEEGSHYVKFNFVNQIWLRSTETNPGSTVFGDKVGNVLDIGLRRTRLSVSGQVSDRVYFFTQFGQNNFNYLSKKYAGSFFHDAIVEFDVAKKALSIGGGLTGWSGLSRYASPSVGSIMTLDAPLYQQATNGVNDQFLRKLSIYAKGKLGKLDYRLILTNPMAVQNATVSINGISATSEFSTKPPKMQSQAYFMWQFIDQESNRNPYTVGTYLGQKKVFNIGAGVIYQPKAMWHLNAVSDTVYSPMLLVGGDVFLDLPLNSEKLNAITAYASCHYFDFGSDYIRNVGVMNPANGINASGTFNGAGDAFPMIGTGGVAYAQFGYLFNKDLLKGHGLIQPYIACQFANYKALDDPMVMFESGLNWYVNGTHGTKLTVNYQNRPVFVQQGTIVSNTQRKGMIQLQLQLSI
jgi:hypothetical protein